MPIRIAVSGEMHGPELPDTIYLLGREKSIQHIEKNVGRNCKIVDKKNSNIESFFCVYLFENAKILLYNMR